ncbi:MAG: hypothetical protein ACK4IY_09415 [Chitinophagales bacterium]
MHPDATASRTYFHLHLHSASIGVKNGHVSIFIQKSAEDSYLHLSACDV